MHEDEDDDLDFEPLFLVFDCCDYFTDLVYDFIFENWESGYDEGDEDEALAEVVFGYDPCAGGDLVDQGEDEYFETCALGIA